MERVPGKIHFGNYSPSNKNFIRTVFLWFPYCRLIYKVSWQRVMIKQRILNAWTWLDASRSLLKVQSVTYARSLQVPNAWPLFTGARTTPSPLPPHPRLQEAGRAAGPRAAPAVTLAGACSCHIKAGATVAAPYFPRLQGILPFSQLKFALVLRVSWKSVFSIRRRRIGSRTRKLVGNEINMHNG